MPGLVVAAGEARAMLDLSYILGAMLDLAVAVQPRKSMEVALGPVAAGREPKARLGLAVAHPRRSPVANEAILSSVRESGGDGIPPCKCFKPPLVCYFLFFFC